MDPYCLGPSGMQQARVLRLDGCHQMTYRAPERETGGKRKASNGPPGNTTKLCDESCRAEADTPRRWFLLVRFVRQDEALTNGWLEISPVRVMFVYVDMSCPSSTPSNHQRRTVSTYPAIPAPASTEST